MRITPADELLLSLLREDARASTADIARRLGLSRTTVQNRIARLEAQEMHRLRVAAAILRTHLREVRVLYSISGGYDLIALAVAGSVGEMDVLTDAIGAIDGVERTTTSIILSTKFER